MTDSTKMARNDSRWLTGKASSKSGRAAMVRWLAEKPGGWTTLTRTVVISWQYPENSAVENEFAAMDRFEDLLQPLWFTSDSCLALVRTFADCRAWSFYVSDPEAFMSTLNGLLRGHSRLPLQFELEDDPAWSSWHFFTSLPQ